MNRHHVPIARIFGISIGLDYSWFLVFILMTWSLAAGYYPSQFPNWSPTLRWVIAGASAIMLFASVLLHELGHSVVALRYGMAVRRITLFIFGGVAEIGAEPPSAVAEFWIALAGPVVSGGLALIFGFLGTFFARGSPFMGLLAYLAYVNGALAVFNLIPGFPLDGGRILRAVVWEVTHSLHRATLVAATAGRIVAFLFILWGVSQIFAGRVGNGLWIAFIGWFLESAAAAEVQQQVLARRLAGHTVSEAMNRQYAAVPPNTLLQALVDQHILGSGRRSFVVTQGDAVLGLVTLHQIREVPRDAWTTATAAQVMTPVTSVKRVRPDTRLWTAIGEMDRAGVNQLPVMVDGQILGMLSREDVIGFLRLLQDLGF
jgi:Zn-dependent protease